LALASVTQTVKSSFWLLRQLRKWQNPLFGACVSDANGKILFLALASATQTANSSFWPLRQRRKRQIPLFGSCVADANGFSTVSVIASRLRRGNPAFLPLFPDCFTRGATVFAMTGSVASATQTAILSFCVLSS
jgi:hypothetical protein